MKKPCDVALQECANQYGQLFKCDTCKGAFAALHSFISSCGCCNCYPHLCSENTVDMSHVGSNNDSPNLQEQVDLLTEVIEKMAGIKIPPPKKVILP